MVTPRKKRRIVLTPEDRAYICAQMAELEGKTAAVRAAELAQIYRIKPGSIYRISKHVRPHRHERADKKSYASDIRRLIAKSEKTIDEYDYLIKLLRAELKREQYSPEIKTRLTYQLLKALNERLDVLRKIGGDRALIEAGIEAEKAKMLTSEQEEPAPHPYENGIRAVACAAILSDKTILADIVGYEIAQIHKKMHEHMEKNPDSWLIVAPRGFGKSTVLTIGEAIFDILRDFDIRECIISDTSIQARAILYQISQILMNNETLTWAFGEFWDGKTKWTEAKIVIAQRKKIFREGTLEAAGFDTAVVGGHFDVMRYDDAVSEENARTEYQRERLLVKYRKKFKPCLMPNGREYFNGTRYHFSDMYHTLMQNGMKDSTLVLSAIVEKRGRERSAWPQMFPIAKLRSLRRELGTMIFNAQYQNDTDAMKGSIFKFEWFRFCDRADVPKELRIYQGVDLAVSQKNTADYFAEVTVGYDPKEKDWYVLDSYHARLSFKAQKESVVRKFKQFDAIHVRVEANAYQAVMAQELRELGGVRVRPTVTHKDKVTRAMKLAALFEDGNVVIVKGQESLVNELLAFPGAEHDDLFDALEIAVSAAKRSGALVVVPL